MQPAVTVGAPVLSKSEVLIATTPALKPLASVKRTRVTATNTLETEVQSGFTNLQSDLNSTSKNIQRISAHVSKEV